MQSRFNNKIKFKGIQLFTVSITISCFLLYLTAFNFVVDNPQLDYSKLIFFLSWIGVGLGAFILYSWKRKTGKVFTFYTIFMLFYFLFNFGQCLMWAMGIHMEREIGTTTLYILGQPTTSDIVKVQLLTLICILTFHCGSMLRNEKKLKYQSEYPIEFSLNAKIELKALFTASILLSLIVVPINFYIQIQSLLIARSHGYSALYYGEFANSGNTVLILISHMFFPCLIGMLLGSNYRKNIKIIVYLLFGTYALIGVMTGDRGEWLYKLLILLWMSNTFYKRLTVKKVVSFSCFGILALYILDVIVSLRNVGITFENIVNSFSISGNPIIEAAFQMGLSMRPTMVLLNYGWDVYPYGNTYLFSIIGSFSERIIYLLGFEYEGLSSWFSQTYLGISYGAGFSIVAEALLNFGPMIAPIFLLLLGYLFTVVTSFNPIIYKVYPIKVFMAISTGFACMVLPRNTMQGVTKGWVYSVLTTYLVVLLFNNIYRKRQN